MMHQILNDTEDARLTAIQMLKEGEVLSVPLQSTVWAILHMLADRGIPIPEDILAWVSYGRFREADVTNWLSPVGS